MTIVKYTSRTPKNYFHQLNGRGHKQLHIISMANDEIFAVFDVWFNSGYYTVIIKWQFSFLLWS